MFLVLVAIGFAAQMVDGALGMAFGVSASSSLMAIGVSPAIASANIHAAEAVTTAISGASHIWNRNVDRKLFFKLAAAGVCGGAVGAHILTDIPGHVIKPLVAIYLAAMAGFTFTRIRGWRMTRWQPPASIIRQRVRRLSRMAHSKISLCRQRDDCFRAAVSGHDSRAT